MRAATSSISHFGVEVAPQTPTRWIEVGNGPVISSAAEIKVVLGLALRHSSNSTLPLELFLPATK